MKPIRLRPLADADIDHAISYLFEENPPAATRFAADAEQAFLALSENPAIGSLRYAHVLPGGALRAWRILDWPWIIFYLERENHLDILRVLHSSRDIPPILADMVN